MARYFFLCTISLAVLLSSCTEDRAIGDWDDNIKLSLKSAEFSSLGDSVTVTTGGDWWWISDVTVDEANYYYFPDVDQGLDYYSIIRACVTLERCDKKTLRIKVDPNPLNSIRTIKVGLQAGNYFDGVTITQKAR